jgi:voltage-gated potassium channel
VLKRRGYQAPVFFRVITHPDHSTILQQGDTVILLGHRGDVPNFARRYALRREMRYRGSSW